MLRRCLPSAGCVLAVSAPCSAAGGRGHQAPPVPTPTFLRFTLAGADVRDGLSFVKHDPKAGYYLCDRTDGFQRSYPLAVLTLSPYETVDAMMDFTPVRTFILPRLRSGKGVNVGDTPPVVEQKLGALATTTSYDRRTNQLIYTYETTFSLTHGSMTHKRMNYKATYTFHDSRLWEMEYELIEPEPKVGAGRH